MFPISFVAVGSIRDTEYGWFPSYCRVSARVLIEGQRHGKSPVSIHTNRAAVSGCRPVYL